VSRQNNLYISQCVELSVVVIKKGQHPVSVTKLPTQNLWAKSFLSPSTECFAFQPSFFTSTCLLPTLLFFALRDHTPYYQSLEKKTCHYLFRAGSKTIFSYPCERENKAVITDLSFKCYHPACGASDIPAKTSDGDAGGDCFIRKCAVHSQKHFEMMLLPQTKNTDSM